MSDVITWKDADQNLCMLAAYLLEEASKEMRGTKQQEGPIPSEDGLIDPGYAEDGGTTTIFAEQHEAYNPSNQAVPFYDQEFDNSWIEMLGWKHPAGTVGWSFTAFGITVIEKFGTCAQAWLDASIEVENGLSGRAMRGPLGMSPLCWWSFQNLIMQRLEEARMDLKDNLFGEGHARQEKAGKHNSRNKGKRPTNGKSGRLPERR